MYLKRKPPTCLRKKKKVARYYAEELTQRKTYAERQFFALLKLLEVKFTFQKTFLMPKTFYIVDFYIHKPYEIVFEIDGKYHDTAQQKEHDKWRTKYLKKKGLQVFRFANSQVVHDSSLREKIKKILYDVLKKRKVTPTAKEWKKETPLIVLSSEAKRYFTSKKTQTSR